MYTFFAVFSLRYMHGVRGVSGVHFIITVHTSNTYNILLVRYELFSKNNVMKKVRIGLMINIKTNKNNNARTRIIDRYY